MIETKQAAEGVCFLVTDCQQLNASIKFQNQRLLVANNLNPSLLLFDWSQYVHAGNTRPFQGGDSGSCHMCGNNCAAYVLNEPPKIPAKMQQDAGVAKHLEPLSNFGADVPIARMKFL
jgi:hypothetical protein